LNLDCSFGKENLLFAVQTVFGGKEMSVLCVNDSVFLSLQIKKNGLTILKEL
jgi:chaperonin GroEL (HSP60 family)